MNISFERGGVFSQSFFRIGSAKQALDPSAPARRAAAVALAQGPRASEKARMKRPRQARREGGGGMNYVYILSNESMPGLLKIGYTSCDPRKRAAELFTTGVPEPFRVELVLISDDAL